MQWKTSAGYLMKSAAVLIRLRRENQAMQRNQFEAEKKVAVADTSIQNLQRTIAQIQEEKAQRAGAVKTTGSRKSKRKKQELEQKTN